MASAPGEVLALVERFDRHRDAYTSGRYNEAQLRREFVDPFFEALGWDVHNRRGHAEAYKDVIHEDSIKVGGETKAPDYCFRVGGTRKFFVEAKKPSVNIKDEPSPAFQLRRYAWSARLPLSILTDFEEFAVYDCRIKPVKTDGPAKARTFYLGYADYAGRWDEIAGIFSHDAVVKGSFDKYAESTRAKRGTAEVDTAFLKEIESWRELLARNLALRNPELTQRQLNFAVQATIDRIIFLRISEDRGIEDYGRLMALLAGPKVYRRLLQLFREADDRYNSGLFHFREEQGRPEEPDRLTPTLTIDDKPLKAIINGLYYPESPYEFSVLPADILGQVYEQFLGKVIRLTPGHRAVVEDKPEVKKAGGIYYTPTYIVDYIVNNTVGKLLEGKTPRQAARLRILDPACGSGSFLIAAYQCLLDWHRDRYLADGPEKHRKRLYEGPGGDWRLATAERKRILLNGIHGVDIDPQAVEVTKLSLLLKVLEGESGEILAVQYKLFRERALPDLGANIKCGNSLIGPDFYDNRQLDLLDEDERYRINVFDWDAEFPDIMRAGGFDAVIGNPPYVILGKDLFNAMVIEYLRNFRVSQYKTDLFHLFIQRGVELLNEKGRFGYIVPNPWLTVKFTDKLRDFILDETSVAQLVIFDHRVFLSADVYTALLFLTREKPGKTHNILIKMPQHPSTVNEIENSVSSIARQHEWHSNEGKVFETRFADPIGRIVKNLIQENPRLEEVARASLGCQAYNRSKHTDEQIKTRIFHESYKAGEAFLPELSGSDVRRYLISRKRGQWIKYGPWLHDYRTMDWLTGPRILVREIPARPPYQIQAAYVEKTYCNYKTILNVNPSRRTKFSMKYLNGIINSKLISIMFPYVANKMIAETFPRMSVRDLRQLPIRTIDLSNPAERAHHDRMVKLVERMLGLHNRLGEMKTGHDKAVLQRQIAATDRQIDRLVYELYGLTESEIRIVEEGANP